ncbi:MAG: Xaa-Pro peptidase family protein [Spirochaetaceae bacterium]|jgi:Xaa-Pro dipeptidase|nr:Xaa-Pro peptidase family protein [Spirochaetaceae bacterium]
MGCRERQEKIYDWMNSEGISLVLFEDCERNRDQSVRYLSGQPGDSILALSAARKSVLIPWDMHMASLYADVDEIIPYTKFELDPYDAAKAAAVFFKIPYGSKIEIPPSTPYPAFLKYVEALSDFNVLCRANGAKNEVDKSRAVKDDSEIEIYRICAQKTNEIIDLLEKNVMNGSLKTESDIALFIEAECRKLNCDGVGFTTLAAGPERSFGIHCFPPFTAGDFAAKGLSILDFGVVYKGYTSDVTLTFARSPNKIQENLLSLVEQAFNLAFETTAAAFSSKNELNQGIECRDIALAVDDFFRKNGAFIPHGLGHGIGLEPHEAPYLRRPQSNTWRLEPGNIFTIEPGLYDPVHGGCRLENDVLITDAGAEILTKSKIIRL